MKNLIPIVVYLVGDNGLEDHEMAMLTAEGQMVYEKTGVFMIPIEYEVDGLDKRFGMMAPLEAHLYLKDRDDVIHQLVDHMFDDLVDYAYWDQELNTFQVKHPDGQVVLFSMYVRTKIQTDRLIADLVTLGEMLEENECADCPVKEECDAFNEAMDSLPQVPTLVQYDIEALPGVIIFTVTEH